jgi:hypothetical protein
MKTKFPRQNDEKQRFLSNKTGWEFNRLTKPIVKHDEKWRISKA